jgi:hypothetical protein
MPMKTQIRMYRCFVRAISVLLLLAPAALPVFAASFSAELVDACGDQTQKGVFNYQDKSYRS